MCTFQRRGKRETPVSPNMESSQSFVSGIQMTAVDVFLTFSFIILPPNSLWLCLCQHNLQSPSGQAPVWITFRPVCTFAVKQRRWTHRWCLVLKQSYCMGTVSLINVKMSAISSALRVVLLPLFTPCENAQPECTPVVVLSWLSFAATWSTIAFSLKFKNVTLI